MRIGSTCSLLLVSFVLGAHLHCSKSEPPAPQITAVLGAVTSTDGAPLSGVTVSGGGVTATTDAGGKFQLDAPAAAATALAFSKPGFIPSWRTVDVQHQSATALAVTMMKEALPLQLDAVSGGTVTGSRGATLIAPAGAFVDKAGSPVTGSVDVHLTPFDPSKAAELDALPGLSASNAGGQRVELESFGVLDVTVRQDGAKLEVANGQQLSIRIPAPAGVASPPATMPLWSFDEASGLWKEEGTATYLAAEKVYEGQIGHMSMWNADQPMTSACIKGLVKVESGAALPGSQLSASGVDYFGFSTATSGSDGRFCMLVRKASRARVLAIHPSGGGTSREVSTPAIDSPVPVSCDHPSCTDVGEWVVTPGKLVGPGGESIDCKTTQNPFAGTCADGMWDYVNCFAASGACKFLSASSTMAWENGSKLVMAVDGETMISTYYGPSGQKCATSEIKQAEPDVIMELHNLITNKRYATKYGESGMAVVCADGTEVALSADKMEAFQACAGGGFNPGQCTVEVPGQCNPGDANPCPGGEKCCPLADNFSMCLAACPE